MMNKFFKVFPTKEFNILFFVFWVFSVVVLLFTNRGDVEILINKTSISAFDKPFYFLTFLGHGTFAVIVLIILMLKNYYHSFYMFFSLLFVTIFSNLFKRLFFLQLLRPQWNFYYDDYSRVIFDAPVNYLRSFPSGHTMTIFALAAILTLIINKRNFSLVFFFIAIMVSISRIYLLQHYYTDILWGAIFGFFAAYSGYCITEFLFKKTKDKHMKSSLFKDLKRWLSV